MRHFIFTFLFLYFGNSVFCQIEKSTNYYFNKLKESEGNVDGKGLKQGEWKYWKESGVLKEIKNYHNDTLDGISINYITNLQVSKMYFTKGKIDSVITNMNDTVYTRCYILDEKGSDSLIFYNSGIKIIRTETKKYVSQNIWVNCRYIARVKDCDTSYLDKSADLNDEIYDVLEQMPEFPGGMKKMYEFLGNNMTYPVYERDRSIQGKVYVSFVVEKDGTLTNIVILKGVSSGLDEEALRVVRLMPKWNPGKQKAVVQRARYKFPIYFKLDE